MELLTDAERQEIETILRKRCRRYSNKAIENITALINSIRGGSASLDDWIVEGIVTNRSMLYDQTLERFVT